MATETEVPRVDEGLRLIHIGVGAFLGTCVLLFILATVIPQEDDGPPGFSVSPVGEVQEDGTVLVTVDTSDNAVWVPFSLELGRVVPVGPAVDLYLRRQMFQAPYGALELGTTPLLESVVSPSSEWVQDIVVDEVRQNPVLSSWYSYSHFSHLLTSKEDTYAVQLASGGIAAIRVISYYCESETSGCMTLHYQVQKAS